MEFLRTEVYGFEPAIRGARNPMNSWHLSDSCGSFVNPGDYYIGEKDMKLLQNLIKAGPEHMKFMRMIQVWVDINMPRYWWSEFDTYGFNSKNSCSTMHKLLNNAEPITEDLFTTCEEDLKILGDIVDRLEKMRVQFRESTNPDEKNRLLVRAKRLLPEGFLQMRTVNTNYAELRNIYNQRKNHRLKEEWQDTFCKWVENLPYADELILLGVKGE